MTVLGEDGDALRKQYRLNMTSTSVSKGLHRGYRHPFVVGTHYFGGIGDIPRTVEQLARFTLQM